MTHRSWFPFILVGLSTALLALIVVVYDPGASAPSTKDAPAATAPTPTEYEAEVRHIVMDTYMTSSGGDAAQVAYDALLALRVPSTSYQDVHIQLVLAFGQLASGEEEAGKKRLAAVEETNPWIFGN